MNEHTESSAGSSEFRNLRVLQICGGLIWMICLAICVLSQRFSWGQHYQGRPVWLFVGLMTVAFLVQLIAFRAAVRLRSRAGVARLIVFLGIAYRLVLLPSHPIQEVDIYRYMWDGAVVAHGDNPYRFSPQDVLQARDPFGDAALASVCGVRDSSAQLADTLSRVHYADLTTIYPPVSQAVFAAAACVLPADAPVPVRRTVTKLLIVVFDVLAMFALLLLLQYCRKPVGWLVCYAWSPLVLKEFANSGHLDSIAVAFSAGAVLLWVVAVDRRSLWWLTQAAVLLGLAVGAKLYPVVIVPVIVASVFRTFGAKGVLVSGGSFLLVSVLTVTPMFVRARGVETPKGPTVVSDVAGLAVDDSPPLPPDFDLVVGTAQLPDAGSRHDVGPLPDAGQPQAVQYQAEPDTGDGFSEFVSRWRMNDLVFLVLSENLVPNSRAWFSVLPNSVRDAVLQPVIRLADVSAAQAAFFAARGIVVAVHLLIVCWLTVVAFRATVRQLPALAFYCVAWFWLLLPTQNPWYWIWALPFVAFARQRSWILIAGASVIYYLRFWLQNDVGSRVILNSGYNGPEFFNFVVVWIEHLPVLLLLLVEWWRRRR